MKKNFICNFILSGLLLLSPLSMFAQRVDSNLPWSVRMVESEMIRCPESWQLDFQPKLKWDYCHGLELQSMLDVYDRYGNRKIYDYALAYADTMVNADGTIKMYKREEYSLDRINSGKFIFRIYEQTKDEKYKKALALMRSQLDEHPRNADTEILYSPEEAAHHGPFSQSTCYLIEKNYCQQDRQGNALETVGCPARRHSQ